MRLLLRTPFILPFRTRVSYFFHVLSGLESLTTFVPSDLLDDHSMLSFPLDEEEEELELPEGWDIVFDEGEVELLPAEDADRTQQETPRERRHSSLQVQTSRVTRELSRLLAIHDQVLEANMRQLEEEMAEEEEETIQQNAPAGIERDGEPARVVGVVRQRRRRGGGDGASRTEMRRHDRISGRRSARNAIRREHAFHDAFRLYRAFPTSPTLRDVRFLDSLVKPEGAGRLLPIEVGVGNGVYREAMQYICRDGFAAEHGLFCLTAGGYLYPNPDYRGIQRDKKEGHTNNGQEAEGAEENVDDHLAQLEFLGVMLGRAMRERMVQDLSLAPHFILLLLGHRNTFAQLKAFDEGLYDQLRSLLYISAESLAALDLTFTTVEERSGEKKEVELVKGGQRIGVTRATVVQYLSCMADFYLNRHGWAEMRAFRQGLITMIPSPMLQLFDAQEVSKLIAGEQREAFDVEDWKAHTSYQHGVSTERTVQLFWRVVAAMTREEQSTLLFFSTSLRVPPLLGFASLSPSFCIELLPEAPLDRLPSASTCFSTLRLPLYTSMEMMRRKLLLAMEAKTYETR